MLAVCHSWLSALILWCWRLWSHFSYTQAKMQSSCGGVHNAMRCLFLMTELLSCLLNCAASWCQGSSIGPGVAHRRARHRVLLLKLGLVQSWKVMAVTSTDELGPHPGFLRKQRLHSAAGSSRELRAREEVTAFQSRKSPVSLRALWTKNRDKLLQQQAKWCAECAIFLKFSDKKSVNKTVARGEVTDQPTN